MAMRMILQNLMMGFLLAEIIQKMVGNYYTAHIYLWAVFLFIFILGWENCPHDSTEDDSTEDNDGENDNDVGDSTEDGKNSLQKMVGIYCITLIFLTVFTCFISLSLYLQ